MKKGAQKPWYVSTGLGPTASAMCCQMIVHFNHLFMHPWHKAHKNEHILGM
jgi:hypothetical protein